MATRFGPLLAWTVGKAVNESTAAHALRAHHSLSGKCASTLCSTARATSEGSGFWGWKQKATEFHSAARNWVRTCEMQVAEVAKRRTYATKAKGGTAKKAGGSGGKREQSLAALQEKEQEALSTFFHEPKGPVTAVEGASYSVVIAGGLAIAATLAYYVVTELFVEKPADKVYNQALEQIKQDPRVMVRLGSPIKGYGSDSRNRRERQRISSRIFKQEDGTEHCQVQFQASGPNGRATVHADMYEKGKDWEFSYLIVDVTYPPAARARINVQTAK